METISQNKRFKKAIFAASLALALCLIPLLARIWLDRNGALERPDLGVVGEFVLRDKSDVPLTRDHLRRSQTIVINWPARCTVGDACVTARSTIADLNTWIEKELRPKWTEENNPLILAIVGGAANQFAALNSWRIFQTQGEEPALLPKDVDLNVPALVIVDNTLQFAAYQDLTEKVDFKRIERVLSKTAFDQYLGNYLSRRTFMGPKRTQN